MDEIRVQSVIIKPVQPLFNTYLVLNVETREKMEPEDDSDDKTEGKDFFKKYKNI